VAAGGGLGSLGRCLARGVGTRFDSLVMSIASIAGGLVAFFAFLYVGLSVPWFLAGWGVLNRRQWARVLSLVLGAIAIGLALRGVVVASCLDIVVFISYAATVFVVLLMPQYAAEFTE